MGNTSWSFCNDCKIRQELGARDARHTGRHQGWAAAPLACFAALLIKAAIAERAEREAVGEEGDVEEEESEQGLSTSLSEGEGEGQEGEESSSSHEALQRGTKRWRPGMPDSSDDEGPHQP